MQLSSTSTSMSTSMSLDAIRNIVVMGSFGSSIAFAHHEVQTAEHRRHVTDQATGQKLRQDTEVHEGGRANFQPIRNAAASAVDVKAKLALGIFGSEIDFARRRIEPFGHHNEMMN